jgi:segregation and condensation protein B
MNPISEETPALNPVPANGYESADEAPAAERPSVEPVVYTGETFMPLTAALESLLFVADKPVDPAQLARALRLSPEVIDEGLRRFGAMLVEQERGVRLQTTQNGKVRLVTRPDAALAVEEFLNLDLVTRLSGPALETLAVVAYRQPVTRAQIEVVRGVDCGGVLRTLLQRGLVEEVGRLEGVGRPFLYGVTEQFMHHFGLTHIGELPPLALDESERLAAAVDQAPDRAHTGDAPVSSLQEPRPD